MPFNAWKRRKAKKEPFEKKEDGGSEKGHFGIECSFPFLERHQREDVQHDVSR